MLSLTFLESTCSADICSISLGVSTVSFEEAGKAEVEVEVVKGDVCCHLRQCCHLEGKVKQNYLAVAEEEV